MAAEALQSRLGHRLAFSVHGTRGAETTAQASQPPWSCLGTQRQCLAHQQVVLQCAQAAPASHGVTLLMHRRVRPQGPLRCLYELRHRLHAGISPGRRLPRVLAQGSHPARWDDPGAGAAAVHAQHPSPPRPDLHLMAEPGTQEQVPGLCLHAWQACCLVQGVGMVSRLQPHAHYYIG